jgi:hypothetical protein
VGSRINTCGRLIYPHLQANKKPKFLYWNLYRYSMKEKYEEIKVVSYSEMPEEMRALTPQWEGTPKANSLSTLRPLMGRLKPIEPRFVAAGHASLRPRRFEALAGLFLLVRRENRLAAPETLARRLGARAVVYEIRKWRLHRG